MKQSALLLLLAGAASLASCSGDEPAAGNAPAGDAPAAADAPAANPPANVPSGAVLASNTVEAEVACAACVYKMEGVTGCQLAATVDGKQMLVTGVPQPGHDSGLCEHGKMATLSGKVEGDKFVATSYTLKP